MSRIDAHQHFWQYHPVKDSWIGEDMAILQADFMPQHLKLLLQQQKMDGCVAVQADQSENETHFLLQLAQDFPFIKGVVGWVDLSAPNIAERLQYFSAFQKLKGFRHIVQAEPQLDFLLREDFCRGIHLLEQFNYTYDILVYPQHLPYVLEFVKRFPEQRFVIDHLAKPFIKKSEVDNWKKDLAQIALQPNAYCKLSGMVTEAAWKGWKKEDFTPYLDAAVEAFGTERLMFGSDWPVCLLAASYAEVTGIVEDYFQPFTAIEKQQVFGGNAIQFYNLGL